MVQKKAWHVPQSTCREERNQIRNVQIRNLAVLDLSGHHSLFSIHMLFLQVFRAFIHGLFTQRERRIHRITLIFISKFTGECHIQIFTPIKRIVTTGTKFGPMSPQGCEDVCPSYPRNPTMRHNFRVIRAKSGKTKEHKLKNSGIWISSGGVGVFHVKGWGPKSLICPSKPMASQTIGWDILRFLPGYAGGAQTISAETNACVLLLAPIRNPELDSSRRKLSTEAQKQSQPSWLFGEVLTDFEASVSYNTNFCSCMYRFVAGTSIFSVLGGCRGSQASRDRGDFWLWTKL